MTRPRKDPLLTFARILLGLSIVLLSFAIVMVSIGVLAVLTVQRGELLAEIAAQDMPPGTYWGLVAGLLAVVAVLVFALRFVIDLRLIVLSVYDGDPFARHNADRLSRMGWLALVIQVIKIPVRAGGVLLNELTGEQFIEMSSSDGGIALILTLFILARVFRKGAEMREELEGTV